MAGSIEIRETRPADDLSPHLKREFAAVLGKYLLPGDVLGRFCIQDETVEVEDDGFEHYDYSANQQATE